MRFKSNSLPLNRKITPEIQDLALKYNLNRT
jgi:hypothetical protein